MQALLEAIKRIQQCIEIHKDRLSRNEMLTRYALIDPLLRALGWDTEDPDQLEPEFVTQQGRPDYTLRHNGQAFILVEAKKLGSDLSDARDSGFKYCWQNKVPFYVITDGNIWELHDLREMGGKQIFRACLMEDNIGDAARHLLALWRPAMPVVQAGLPIILEPTSREHPSPQQLRSSLSLQELRSKVRSGREPPKSIIFPDGSTRPLNSWKDLLVAVARFSLPYLQQRNEIPLRGRRGKGFLIGRSKDMRSPKKLDNRLFVETHDSAKGCVRRACQILEAAGIDLEKIRVEV
ncbi:MAG: hypothetical protein NZ930_07150 [Candidatus Bipolaricaulota bacterium]|nr:hypothetical protein [Candidatus Bipolaricaulota bacterium]MDW8031816.1 hypothetical protein [Candidatus Bipolaricaulota bacterium]